MVTFLATAPWLRYPFSVACLASFSEAVMSQVSITLELDVPEGVGVLEYERHGEGHPFTGAGALPGRCCCDGCGPRGPTRLEYKSTFYTVRDLDVWGQPSFWVY